MPIIADRVKETSTTTGTDTLNLEGAVSGFQGFVAGIGNGVECYYCITDTSNNWEVGRGTVTDATPDTLSRSEVFASSNAGALVNFPAGTKTVFATIPGIDGLSNPVIYGDGSDGVVTFDGTTAKLGMTPSASEYSMTRNIYLAHGSVVNTGVKIKTNGFQVFCSGLLTLTGTAIIHNNGADGQDGNGTAGLGGAGASSGVMGGGGNGSDGEPTA